LWFNGCDLKGKYYAKVSFMNLEIWFKKIADKVICKIISLPHLVFFIQNFGSFVTKNKPSANPANIVPPAKIIK